jgi:WD40 repeat protein
VAFSQDGALLVSASADKTVKLWNASSGHGMRTLKGHTDDVYRVAFSPDGARLASASTDNTVRIWDAASGQELRTLQGHRIMVEDLAFSPDGTRLASSGTDPIEDDTVRIWDSASGRELRTIKGYRVAFSPDGTRLAIACAEADASGDFTLLKLWDAASGRELRTLGRDGMIQSLAFSPDGRRLASSNGGDTRVWDVASGQELRTIEGNGMAFSPDGRRLASATGENTVTVWDAESGQELCTLKGHRDQVHRLVFCPDGLRLASASADGTIKMWDTAYSHELYTLKGHMADIWDLAFSPDGWQLASAGKDQTIKLWDARPLTTELRTEREALGLVEWLFNQPLPKASVAESIRDNKAISEEIQRKALAFAERFPEERDPERFITASRSLVRQQHLAPRWYRQALVQAEAACRMAPGQGSYFNTLGIAQYRLGKYAEAVDTLTHSDQLSAAGNQGSRPADLAFLAMAHWRLGQKEKAQDYLDRLRQTMKEGQWSDGESQAFLREAEALQGQSDNPQK